MSSGAKATTVNGELIFGYGWVFNTASAGAGFTPISLVNGDLDEYQVRLRLGNVAPRLSVKPAEHGLPLDGYVRSRLLRKYFGGSIGPLRRRQQCDAVTLSGAANAPMNADANGNYTFSSLAKRHLCGNAQ